MSVVNTDECIGIRPGKVFGNGKGILIGFVCIWSTLQGYYDMAAGDKTIIG
jgi:hypothetical protein